MELSAKIVYGCVLIQLSAHAQNHVSCEGAFILLP